MTYLQKYNDITLHMQDNLQHIASIIFPRRWLLHFTIVLPQKYRRPDNRQDVLASSTWIRYQFPR